LRWPSPTSGLRSSTKHTRSCRTSTAAMNRIRSTSTTTRRRSSQLPVHLPGVETRPGRQSSDCRGRHSSYCDVRSHLPMTRPSWLGAGSTWLGQLLSFVFHLARWMAPIRRQEAFFPANPFSGRHTRSGTQGASVGPNRAPGLFQSWAVGAFRGRDTPLPLFGPRFCGRITRPMSDSGDAILNSLFSPCFCGRSLEGQVLRCHISSPMPKRAPARFRACPALRWALHALHKSPASSRIARTAQGRSARRPGRYVGGLSTS
jgi:hypothetical protein